MQPTISAFAIFHKPEINCLLQIKFKQKYSNNLIGNFWDLVL